MTIVNILFRGLCNIYIETTDRERTRGNRRQLLFRASVKSHSLVMRKFVHSSRELFPHLVDARRDYWRTRCVNADRKNWRCTGTTHDPMTYIRKMTYYDFNYR